MIACFHYYALTEDGEDNFTVNANTITFGKRGLRDAGDLARLLGIDRIALFTDRRLATTPHVFNASPSPTPNRCRLYDEVRIEPTDISFKAASDFASEGNFEGFMSVGGGSVDDASEVLSKRLIDLMKATNMPNGISGVGYGADDLVPLTDGAFPQQRLLRNASLKSSKKTLAICLKGR